MFTGWLLMRFYFNPRSPCGERPRGLTGKPRLTLISIHAPRAGSDDELEDSTYKYEGISIHAPRAGSDGSNLRFFVTSISFQSTLPVRGATREHMAQ